MYLSVKKEKLSIKEGQNTMAKYNNFFKKLIKANVVNNYITNFPLEHNSSEQSDKYSQTCPYGQLY
jgi:aspartyl/asparaginyl beta-hydroxylase (cupin superfamily)